MKIVLNKCYGGFGLSYWALDQLGIKTELWIERNDPRLIELVEQYPDKVSGNNAQLEVVEIPSYCTDWEINEYDGFESIIYVVCGKIYHE